MKSPFIDLGFIQVTPFGAFFFIGLVVGIYLTWKQAKTRLLPENDIFDALFISFIAAFFGARLSFVALNSPEFGWNILSWLAFWVIPGFYVFGGMLAGTGALYFVCRSKKELKFWETLDLFSFSFWVAILITLIGTFLSGYEQGRPSPLPEITHPVALYRFVGLGILLIPYLAYRFEKEHETSMHARPGLFSLLFISSFSFVWFVVDFIRTNALYISILTLDQWIMLVVFIASTFLLFWYHKDWFAHVFVRMTSRSKKKH